MGALVVAPFFADFGTSVAGQVSYGTREIGGRAAFGATWSGVAYHGVDPLGRNDFEAVLIDRADTGVGNFDLEFNYGRVEWESGDVSGGSGGLGGDSARVGFAGGLATDCWEAPGSGMPGELLDGGVDPLSRVASNSQVSGRKLFGGRRQLVRGDRVQAAGAAGRAGAAAARRRADVRGAAGRGRVPGRVRVGTAAGRARAGDGTARALGRG